MSSAERMEHAVPRSRIVFLSTGGVTGESVAPLMGSKQPRSDSDGFLYKLRCGVGSTVTVLRELRQAGWGGSDSGVQRGSSRLGQQCTGRVQTGSPRKFGYTAEPHHRYHDAGAGICSPA